MTIYETILKLRKQNGYSQIEIADKLQVTRQTYMKMESGKAPTTTDNLQIIANIYGIPIEEFFYGLSNKDKFKQIYMYVLSLFKQNGIPKTKLAKLLYLIDFRHFYENLESMSGILYKHQQYGPVPDIFHELTDELFENGDIKIEFLTEGAQMISPLSNIYKDGYNLLSKKEIKEIEEVCKV